jgi:hypothetical protein
MKLIIGLVVTLALSFSLWFFVYKTFPMFQATEVIEQSNAMGRLTPEEEVLIRAENLKSSLVVYTAWGIVLGLIGAVAGGVGGPGFLARIGAGVLLGAVVGAGTNYLSNWYALRSAPPMDPIQYWVVRTSVVHIPLALATALVATLGNGWNKLGENAVKGVVAIILVACLYSFLMGFVTPIEQAQYIFPGFTQNSFALLTSANVLLFIALSFRFTRKAPSQNAQPTQTNPPA